MSASPGKLETAVALLATKLATVSGAVVIRWPGDSEPEDFGDRDNYPTDTRVLISIDETGGLEGAMSGEDGRSRGEMARHQTATVLVRCWAYAIGDPPARSQAFIESRRDVLNAIEQVYDPGVFGAAGFIGDWVRVTRGPSRAPYAGFAVETLVTFHE